MRAALPLRAALPPRRPPPGSRRPAARATASVLVLVLLLLRVAAPTSGIRGGCGVLQALITVQQPGPDAAQRVAAPSCHPPERQLIGLAHAM